MIILDTNVISEAMRPSPHAGVMLWLNDQSAETLYITTITLAEVMYGVSALPAGRRRAALQSAAQGLLDLFDNRVLPFGTQEALHYGQMAGVAHAQGKRLPTTDGYIAAIAAAHGFSVATRGVKPFQNAGIDVINPWL